MPEFARDRRRSVADRLPIASCSTRCAARRAIDYAASGRLKHAALRAAFERFSANEWCHDTGRARDLKAFISEQAWWIEDYALFRAIHAQPGRAPVDRMARRRCSAANRRRSIARAGS